MYHIVFGVALFIYVIVNISDVKKRRTEWHKD